MNIFSRIKTALGMSAAKPIVAAGDAVLAAGVKAAMSTEIGAAAATAIQAAEVPGATGAAKKAQAVEAAAPAVVLYVAQRGLTATLEDAKTFVGHVIEAMLAELRLTGPSAIAEAVLALAAGAVKTAV